MGQLTSAVNTTIDCIKTETKSLSDQDFVNVLDEVSAQCESMADAKREERDDLE